MHSKYYSTIQGTIKIGVIFTLCICLVLTQLAYASSGPDPFILNYPLLDRETFLPISSNIENEEEGNRKTLRSETYERELSNVMSPSDYRKPALPFEFELPIPFP
jgi:hypothetical protein